jgi:hypothetical protein
VLEGMAGDEDPLPPNGANPHPLPLEDHGFWHDQHMHMEQMNVDKHTHNVAVADGIEPAAPATPHQSPPSSDQDVVAEIAALIAKLVDNAANIVPKHSNDILSKASCHISETTSPDGIRRNCIL